MESAALFARYFPPALQARLLFAPSALNEDVKTQAQIPHFFRGVVFK